MSGKPEIWGDGCECWVTPEHLWTTHYGAVEPGSQLEFNPECPKHGAPPLPTGAELAAEYDRERGYDRPLEAQAADARHDLEQPHTTIWCPLCRKNGGDD